MTERENIFEYGNEPKCGFYLVGLVDILGQKQKLAELDQVSVDSPGEFGKKFIENWRAIQRLRTAFQKTCDAFFDQRKSDKRNETLSGLEREIYEYYQNPPQINFQGLSDTVIFYIDLSSQKKFLPTSAVLLSLIACSAAVTTLMALGHTVRGGIDVGRAGEIYAKEIYGPALNCAYHLESKKADWPRILIGEGLLGYLQSYRNLKDADFPDLPQNGEHQEELADYLVFGSKLKGRDPKAFQKYVTLLKKDADLCRQHISQDVDQNFILDYFGQPISKLLAQEGPAVFKMAYDFAVTERERFDKASDPVLHPRYVKLCKYLESRASFWG